MSAPNVPPQVPAPAPNVPPQVPAPAPMPPAAAAPSTELPRHHVHHSYIWLESVRTIFIIAVCVVVANFSTIIGLVAEEGMGAEAGFIMAVAGIGTLVVILITFGIVAGLVPEFSDLPQEAKPVAKVALRRAVLRQSIWFGGGFWLAVVVTVCLMVFGWVNGEVATGGIELDSEDLFLLSIGWNVIVVGGYALAAVLFIVDIVNAVLWARESSFAYNHRFMQVSNGGLSRETVSFPRQKIQFGCTKSNPLQRRAGTDTLLATTAAGSGGTTTTLIDASHADAMAWLDWLKPGGNQ